MNRAFYRIKDNDGGKAPSIPPILLALLIVTTEKDDIENITASHPDIKTHEYYDPKARFPHLLHFLPQEGKSRWWERIRTVPLESQLVALASGPAKRDLNIEMADGAEEPAPQAAIANASARPKVSRICFAFSNSITLLKAHSKAVCKGCQPGSGGDRFIARGAKRGEQISLFDRFVLD